MNFPLISEYIESIKSAEDNFKELNNLCPVLEDDGQPVLTSGNFAVVFKMKDEETGKCYALKCFTKEQQGRAEAYKQIAEELKDVDSPYLVSIRYFDKELFVDTEQTDETEFPVLLMDWVEGKTLDKYLRENLDDKYALEMLAYRFCQLAQWLIPQSFAHGDLKPDNILVREDGSLVLVDYDGMYVPAMKGQKARELGSPDFRHPLRTESDFDEHIDEFSLSSIMLSLKAISLSPLLLLEFGDCNRLLLAENDYRDLSQSPIMKILLYMMAIKDFALTYSIFISSFTNYKLNKAIESAIGDLRYESTYPDMLCHTKLQEIDHKRWFEDGMNVGYSIDGKRLLYGSELYSSYEIHEGTEIICDKAFAGDYYGDGSGWRNLEQVIIPRSVKYIGVNPFAFSSVRFICHSPYFILENNALYTDDKKLLIGYYGFKDERFEIPEGVRMIGNYAFAGRGLKYVKLSSTVEVVGDSAFLGCRLLENIEFSKNIKHIGNNAFNQCDKLNNIVLPCGLLSIGNSAFYWCRSISSITIPASTLSIGVNPFAYSGINKINCNSCLFENEGKALYSIGKRRLISCYSKDLSFNIPNDVSYIGENAFLGCPFKQLYIHDNITYIGKGAFDGCYYSEGPYGFGYSMEVLVSKGRFEWARKQIMMRIPIKEIDKV